MTDMAHWAAQYADRLSWAVFPLHGIREDGRCRGCGGEKCAGKHPISAHWERSIPSATAALSLWRSDLGQRGIGLVCGVKSGVWVLDVDVETGGYEQLRELRDAQERRVGAEIGVRSPQPLRGVVVEDQIVPRTWRARTGSGGEHLFFRAPPDDSIRNSASQIAPGLDVRGAGGYVVLPPSPHQAGGRYEWLDAPLSVELADAPRWLAMLATLRPRKKLGTHKRADDRNGNERLMVAAGRRHDYLIRFCGILRSQGMCEEAIVECGQSLIRHHFVKEPAMDLAQAERDMRDVARRYPPDPPNWA